jgi:hypothetical protein
MPHVTEINLSKEEKRPSSQPYSSDTRWASVKVTLYPGDDVDAAIATARDALARAFAAAPLQRDVPRDAAATPSAWQLRVSGSVGERHVFAKHGFRWDRNAWARDAQAREELDAWASANADILKGRAVATRGPGST